MSEPVQRVLAVVVVHNGIATLSRALDALGRQHYAALDVVAVDNASTDGSRDLLVDRLGPDAVLLPERDLGFGGAVDMALDAQLVAPDLVLLVHDDLVLEPRAVGRLVRALERDASLAAVGPKLRWLDDPRLLQTVGFAVDLTGRVEHGVERDEVDHGQRDTARDVLAVSSAGMLVRHADYRAVGGFDRRYHVFRDDLDLCWRLWVAGRRVGVEPRALGDHGRAAADLQRLGQARQLGPRYFAERNTLATLLKVRSAARLPAVVALYLALGLVRIVGFVLTRRFSDGWQTGRAFVWNAVHLPGTLRLRRIAQSQRARDDRQLMGLMDRLAPRLRSYLEAVADVVTGGTDVGPAIQFDADEPVEAPSLLTRLVERVRRRPLAYAGGCVLAVVALGSIPLWRGGRLRGGELTGWPEDTSAWASGYLSSWHDVPGIATDVAPSPEPLVLAGIDLLALGNDWLAPRLLLLAVVPLAWLFAVRALREVTSHTGGRALGATAYALSPPVLAAIAEGRLGAMVVAVLLPAAGAAIVVTTRAQRSAGAWRGAAALVVAGVVMIAFEPVLVLAVPAAAVAVLVLAVWRGLGRGSWAALPRFGLLVVATPLLALPWLPTLGGRLDDLLATPVVHDLTGASGIDMLLLAPGGAGWVGPLPGLVLLLAALVGVVLAAAHRPYTAVALWSAAGLASAWAQRLATDPEGPWPGVALLVVALSLAGVVALGTSRVSARVATDDLGWRQLGVLGTLGLLLVGTASGVAAAATSGWSAWTTAQVAIPAFVAAETEAVGPFDVLVLASDDELVRWDVTAAAGPDLRSRGHLLPEATQRARRDVVGAIVGGSDPAAATRLGQRGVRYVVVPPGGASEDLTAALTAQLDLEPLAVAESELYRVTPWQPPARAVPQEQVALVGDVLEPLPASDVLALDATDRPGEWIGRDVPAGLLTVTAPPSPAWSAVADGRVLEPAPDPDNASFVLASDAERVEVRHARQGRRTAMVGVQALTLVGLTSLLLRPPTFSFVPLEQPPSDRSNPDAEDVS